MNFDEIPLAQRVRLDVRISGEFQAEDKLKPETECAFFRDPRGNDVLLTSHAEAFLLTTATDESEAMLNECLDRDLPRIAG